MSSSIFPIGVAFTRTFRSGYGVPDLTSDLMAGFVVSVVALPLSMALAIACDVPPQHGLYTAIIAGFIAAVAGGSAHQVTGPTAAFVVILLPVVREHGLAGLMTATLLAGFMLVGLGVARLGAWIAFIPLPVIAGFTAGIGATIAVLQLPDLVGVRADGHGAAERVLHLLSQWQSANLSDLVLGLGVLMGLVVLGRRPRRIPAPLVVLTAATALGFFLEHQWGWSVGTISDRFGELPRSLPSLSAPWSDRSEAFTWSWLNGLFPAAIAIATLGAIESLLSAVIADGMTGQRHDPDAELVGQGLANIGASFFGGFAATGALARTATNVRSGARSPVAAAVSRPLPDPLHAGARARPRTASDGRARGASPRRRLEHGRRAARDSHPPSRAPQRSGRALGRVHADGGVRHGGRGVHRRRSRRALVHETNGVVVERALGGPGCGPPRRRAPAKRPSVPDRGAALLWCGRASLGTLGVVDTTMRGLILDLGKVPTIDATGLVNLESAIARVRSRGVAVALVGLRPEVRQAMQASSEQDGWRE
ncbi:MAG: STAS domain-containing protein [Myxococcales bacterium]|nr:STAS domain-containing protein [Myxococcales bacterium]